MADEPTLDSLTPYSDALRDLTNILPAFEAFTKIGPILQRVAEVEGAIPKAKQTLDRIASAIDQATRELDMWQAKIAVAKEEDAKLAAILRQRGDERVAQIRAATQKVQAEAEAEQKRIADDLGAAQARAATARAALEQETRTRTTELQNLKKQIEDAQAVKKALVDSLAGAR